MLALPLQVSSQTAVIVANFVLFQIVWLCNVMTLPFWDWISLFVALGAHLFGVVYFCGPGRLRAEVFWLAGVGVCGWLVEAGFLVAGVITLGGSASVPYWLINLWLAFATTFRFSLLPLIQRPFWLAACAPLACLSYWGGVELNADAEFGLDAWAALLVIAVVWGLVLPALGWFFRRHVL